MHLNILGVWCSEAAPRKRGAPALVLWMVVTNTKLCISHTTILVRVCDLVKSHQGQLSWQRVARRVPRVAKLLGPEDQGHLATHPLTGCALVRPVEVWAAGHTS